jgi:hypothetical protein
MKPISVLELGPVARREVAFNISIKVMCHYVVV